MDDPHGVFLDSLLSRLSIFLSNSYKSCSDLKHFVTSFVYQMDISELDNPTSQTLHQFVQYLNDQKPFAAPLTVIRYLNHGSHMMKVSVCSLVLNSQFVHFWQSDIEARLWSENSTCRISTQIVVPSNCKLKSTFCDAWSYFRNLKQIVNYSDAEVSLVIKSTYLAWLVCLLRVIVTSQTLMDSMSYISLTF